MRELKFRAWDIKRKRYMNDLTVIKILPLALDKEVAEGLIEVEQYTGLKDKNGKEIYEGDIVKFDDIDSEAEVSKPAEVIMEDGAFLTKCADGELYILEDGTPVVLGLIKNELYQVIGNIHENKELLEEK